MVIWLHLTGGGTFPPRRNSALSMRPPRGLPPDSREQRSCGRPRGGCGRPWSTLHKSAGYAAQCAFILLQIWPSRDPKHVSMFIRLETRLKRILCWKWDDETKKRCCDSNSDPPTSDSPRRRFRLLTRGRWDVSQLGFPFIISTKQHTKRTTCWNIL